MRLKLKYHFFLWGFVLILFSISCEELPCAYPDGVNVNAAFYKSNGIAISDTSIGSFTMHLVTEIDTPYIEDYLQLTHKISFPLSMNEDTSTIILTFQDLTSDTLILKYNRTLALESHPCGFDTFFEIIEIINTNNRLDSVWIKKDFIEYGNEENIKIYF